jgi:CRISPR-associated protein (TIGR03986 family)
MPGDFHNPYSFVPPADPKGAGAYDADLPDEHPLGQGRPAGHDRYRPGLWSGRIGIAIEAVTPLLIPEATPVREIATGADKHKVYRTRRAPGGGDSTPLLPVTSFRGALRSAYEAVTNSRFGVFRGHGAPLARRMGAGEGLSVVPARLIEANGRKSIELWLGTRKTLPGQAPLEEEGSFPTTYAAWFPMWRSTSARNFANQVQHGDEVICRLQRIEHTAWRTREERHQRDFDFWEVVTFRKVDGSGRLDLEARAEEINRERRQRSVYRPVGEPIMARGFVVATGRNFGRKHDERVFFLPDHVEGSPPMNYPLSEEEFDRLALGWTQLIDNSQDLHAEAVARRRNRGEAPEEYFGREPGRTAYSRHVLSRAERQLTYGTPFSWDNDEHRPGTLCYARVQMKDKQPIVEALFPVMIGRELGNWSPFEMLHEGLRPATSIDQLSPADRVFGWVRDESANRAGRSAGTSGPKPPAAWKGQLRIAPIRCGGVYDGNGEPLYENGRPAYAIQTVGDGREGLPLAILSMPKPSQARFYAACDKSGTPFENGAKLRQKGYFGPRTPQPQAGLRGRKVYPHHGAAGSVFHDYWDPAGAWHDARTGRLEHVPHSRLYREYVRRTQTEGQAKQDSQNRSVLDWVRPGTRFSTHVDVVNLSAAELGALLWLLDLGRKHDRQPPAHLRLGGGKPLGFGSVRVWITSLDLWDGEAKRQEYRSFLGISGAAQGAPPESGLHLSADEAAVGTQLDNPGGPVAAFKRAMKKAYGDGKADTFESLALIAAFLVAARGFDDALPLHYPRCGEHPDPDGNNYEWFVANQRQHGQKLSLPDITTDGGLPRNP